MLSLDADRAAGTAMAAPVCAFDGPPCISGSLILDGYVEAGYAAAGYTAAGYAAAGWAYVAAGYAGCLGVITTTVTAPVFGSIFTP